MSIEADLEQILETAHFWNWLPDWGIVKEIHSKIPNSYSVLTPFAFAYLEELIRSMTTDYEYGIVDRSGNPRKVKVGINLVNMAIDENKGNPELILLLENIKPRFAISKLSDKGDNRNSVAHGYIHPRFWDENSFESLIHDIATLSRHAGF